MADPDFCTEHAWTSVGVTVLDGTVSRVWDCEYCPAWTSNPLEETAHVPFEDTDIGSW